MCVSTGNAGTPNACAITTDAVLCPTPGNSSSAPKSAGTCPPCFSTSNRDNPAIATDFCGDNPHGLINSRISSTGTAIIASGVAARANNPGVTKFTRASVHCADNSTATSNVNASR